MSHLGGMSFFAQKKMCDYQRSSEHVVTRRGSTGRSTVPYRCTIDVQTHMGPSDGPTRPPGAPSEPDGPPADRRRHRRTPFNRGLPGLGGPQLLLAQPRLLVIAALPINLMFWCWIGILVGHGQGMWTGAFRLASVSL